MHGKFKEVLIFNNTDKDNNTARRINYNEVVLVTYAVIRKSFPVLDNETMQQLHKKAADEKKSFAEILQGWVTQKEKLAGCLHNIHWYRVCVSLLLQARANI
jgi:hypothetical protein